MKAEGLSVTAVIDRTCPINELVNYLYNLDYIILEY